MTNFKNVRFWGENERLPRTALTQPSFHFKPKHVESHFIPVSHVAYPYSHLKNAPFYSIHVPTTNYKHAHLKGLYAHATPVKELHLQHPEELGIKEHTKKITVPNEAVYEMGIPNTDVNKFATANLQEEAGTVNDLVLHRDDQNFENVPMNKFMDTYSKYIKDRLTLQKTEKRIQMVDEATKLTPEEKETVKENIIKKFHKKNKLKLKLKPIETIEPQETIFQKAVSKKDDDKPVDTDDVEVSVSEKENEKETPSSSAEDDEVIADINTPATEIFKYLKSKKISGRTHLDNIPNTSLRNAIKEQLIQLGQGYTESNVGSLSITEAKRILIAPKSPKKPPKPPSSQSESKGEPDHPPPTPAEK